MKSSVLNRVATTAIKALSLSVLSLSILLVPAQAHSQIQKMDKIVAVVDSGVVLESELTQRVASIKIRFANQPGQLPPEDILREQILERLISENIQIQMAERSGIYITDEQLSAAFTQLATSQGLTQNQMMQQLNTEGESVTGVMRDLRQELTLQQVQDSQVNRRIYISESEVENFLKSAEGQFWLQPTLNLQHIQIDAASNAGPSEVESAKNLAFSVVEKLKQGERFETMAIQFSNSPTALEGGNIGWRRPIEFPPEINEVLEKAEIGTTTEAIRSSGGYHIFHVVDAQGGERAEFIQQTKTRHILIQPNQIRSSEESRQLAEELRERVLAGESFEELAKEYSEDISNSLKGGDLDWVLPGVMVPEFEDMMNKTETGEVSEPVETRFGWHILKVEDRREEDMSSNIIKNQARNVLRTQRYPEELDLWTREIRSDAFVSIIE